MRLYLPLIFLLLLIQWRAVAQQTTAVEIDFSTRTESGGIRFQPILPPLPKAIAGGRAPFYTCFWEFGDGSHSEEETPLHMYRQAGDYEASLTATIHYDDGKSPRRKKKKTTTSGGSAVAAAGPGIYESKSQPIALAIHREPRPEEELILVCSYRNLSKVATDGELYLFFNEKAYKTRHFSFQEARTHYGEQQIQDVSAADPDPDPISNPNPNRFRTVAAEIESDAAVAPAFSVADELLAEARKTYRDSRHWRFSSLESAQSRNVYISLDALSTMLKDTTATIYVDAIFAPDNPMVPAEHYTLEMQIVGSHDPNLIAVSDRNVNYRHLRRENLSYKVRFQNNGEGPAKKIRVTIDIPEGLKAADMRPQEWYPKCPICPKNQPITTSCLDTTILKKKIIFTFNNVYLPGSRQDDVSDKDSTKGFVKYRLQPKKNIPKRSFSSKAGIVFDNNPPVVTNFAHTTFKPGISPGLKVGYGFHPDSISKGYLLLGISLSPYKSWRFYPQIEVLSGIKGSYTLPESDFNAFEQYDIVRSDNGIIQKYDSLVIRNGTRTSIRRYTTVELPVLIRRNISRFIGFGLGGSARIIWYTGTDNLNGTISTFIRNTAGETFENQTKPLMDQADFRSNSMQFTVFGDMTLGAVRAGPNLGLRAGYLLDSGQRTPFVQISAEWKL